MIPVSEAAQIILNLARSPDAKQEQNIEQIQLSHALGRVLAQDLVSDPLPAWPNSAMDGYALRHVDLEQYQQLQIVETIAAAGEVIAVTIQPGQCMRIFTGGMLPAGADTVVMQEETIRQGDRLELKTQPKLAAYVRQRGSYYDGKQPLIQQGSKISATEIGLLAAISRAKVKVHRLPRVAIFSTGNELVELAANGSSINTGSKNTALKPGQIIDSNNHALTALVNQAGAIAQPLGIVSDREADLKAMIQTAIAKADLVISSGGVSVGDYDLVDRVLASLGAMIHVRACAIKPGKPLTVATIERADRQPCLYFGLPGNPASAMVCFWRFIKGAIAKLRGEAEANWQPRFIHAITTADLNAQGRRETYLWGKLRIETSAKDKSEWHFDPAPNHISGNLVSLAGTDALAVLKINQTYVPAGDRVLVMLV
ncbi:molybdopterin molybdochelatase [Thalassoporum mexicanum PCC 7367]|uniref:molybdopterin molybdotransferase MoeA n=1 Tax=Thalassoporum mexicanum TaxID=3457544 RepID=UPI00029FD9D0|nr:gephyrin-like molybdotransferase Glp [Pseudanabaena sp. PCC 7367]AFY71726.1 molybdopterin molybdochelatase [Pseudanabaena sp. PCC 7367]